MIFTALVLIFAMFRWTGPYRAAWVFVGALMGLSVEAQVSSVLGISIARLGFANLAVAILLAFDPTRRDTLTASVRGAGEWIRAGVARLAGRQLRCEEIGCEEPGRAGIGARFARVGLILLTGMVLVRGALYLPEAGDPYHLMKMDKIVRTGSLAYIPCADYKINTLGFLYELWLSDLRAIPFLGSIAMSLANAALLAAVALTIAAWFGRVDPRGERIAVWSGLIFAPVLSTQFFVVKNDLFVAALALPALALSGMRESHARSRPILVGLLSGLAFATKGTTIPVLAAALLFFPARSWREMAGTRGWILLGFALGTTSGGFLFTTVSNLNYYDHVVGPISQTGNLPRSVTEVGVAVSRLVISLFDLGFVTPRWWPHRGGSAAHLGVLFAILSILYLREACCGRQPWRTGVLFLVVCLLFAILYPDADVAHRLIIAPAFLFMATVVHGLLCTTPRSGSLRIVQAASLVSLVVALFVGGVKLARLELLRWPHVVESTVIRRVIAIRDRVRPDRVGHEAWQMRRVRAQARAGHRVAYIAQEQYLVLEGVDYTSLATVESIGSGRFGIQWRTSDLDAYDVFIVGPNDFPPDADVLQQVRSLDGSSMSTITGTGVSWRALPRR